jgi:hypothetical protein
VIDATRSLRDEGPINSTKEAPMKDAIYGGVNAAVLTAMKPDLTPDLDRMAADCARHSGGAHDAGHGLRQPDG